jgi:glycosyltransferase involved in cell wall biosynthesis
MKPLISIIIPTYNEEKHIATCITSLLAQDIKEPFDIIIADGMSTDTTRSTIQKLQKKNKNIILLDNKEKHQAQGRNIAIHYSKAPYIAYLDGHSYASKDWLRTLYTTHKELEQKDDKLGGVGSIHYNASPTALSEAITTAMNSTLGGGTQTSFGNKKNIKKVETAYACLFKKNIFDKVGYYDKKFLKGQDLELNLRISKKYHLYLQPKAVTYYYKRATISLFWKQMYRYGFWRWKVMQHLKSYQLFTFFPNIIVSGISISIIVGLIIEPLLLIIPLIYLLLITINSMYYAIKKKIPLSLLILSYLCIHFGYGIGMMESLFRKKDRVLDR